MQKNGSFNFNNSYTSLPHIFYSMVQPDVPAASKIFLLNKELCKQLNVSAESQEDIMNAFLVEASNKNATTYAQAYAGHQYGHFRKLGDGRAIMVGEHLTKNNSRFDIQLKGSGQTIYSRNGDGKATLQAMLREYIMSEAIHFLNIPSSRSLAIIKTGETVYRETEQEGGMLVRVMKSHIRVGTFEYAAHFGTIDDLQSLTNYTIQRLYPEIENDENLALSLLNKVMANQINVVANWLRVGFIHGVMNTDNTSISGETFDYGPCAFMNAYHPHTVYSSIDHNGRYAFGNQTPIIKWNLMRLAEALLPIIHENNEKSIELAQSAIDGFDALWEKTYYGTMLKKIGIDEVDSKYYKLVDELLTTMKNLNMDYTNTFRDLSQEVVSEDSPIQSSGFKPWLKKWKETIEASVGMQLAQQLMRKNNPVVIPRNHIVEQALDEAVHGNMELFNKLVQVVSHPYEYQEGIEDFMKPSDSNFERNFQTYCGT